MNKISMDALNTGWNLGFGTAVRSANPDFDAAAARVADHPAEAAPRQSGVLAGFVADLVGRADAWFRTARAAH